MAPDAPTAELDTRGQRCPIPVLKARKRMKALAQGDTLRLLADDPVADVDVPHFCREDGHTLIARERGDAGTAYLIRKG